MLPLLLLLAIPAVAETVEIVRDSFGTPHIFATTAAGAAFGAGYAQVQDRREALLTNLSSAGEAVALPAELQAVVNAYVAGVNQGLGESRVTAAQVVAFSRRAYAWIHGSNDLFLSPSRTTSKSMVVVLDPIADWNAADRPYEMSLYASNGDLSLAGVTPPGMPFPVVGHSQYVAIGWSGDAALAGPRALEEAWSLITAHNFGELQAALAMQQIPGRASCGTPTGELCQVVEPQNPIVREKLRVQNTWSLSAVEALAFSTEVYKSEVWVRLLSRLDPNSRLVRLLTGWNGRTDADSRGALAFYIFKMELGRDASAVEPPDSLSKARILAAITRALDKLETEYDFNANWGSVFRVTRDGARVSFPAFGGNLPEAGIETPRTLYFREQRAYAGQAATRIVDFSNASAASVLMPGVSDDIASRYFTDQSKLTRPKSTYFRNRRDLERAASSREQITF